MFERILLFDQITTFFNKLFSKFLCGFRKGFCTQTALFNLISKWQKLLDDKKIIGTLLIDLSKAYDCINHSLLLAKLEAYGFSSKSLKLLKSYLKNRKQRVKLFSTFSNWLEIYLGIPQGSILGPLLFNIFINDIFDFLQETVICNFADDNTIYAEGNHIDEVINKLMTDVNILVKWFNENSLVANPSKFQLMFLGTKESEEIPIKISNNILKNKNEVELLGVTIDNKLNFSSHINRICKTANNKLSAIIRLRKHLTTSQASELVNAHVISHFLYCPLIWMFCNKGNKLKIDKVHKRSLKTILQQGNLNLSELLYLNESLTIHQKHIQFLMIEVYKALKNISPDLLLDIFKPKLHPYNFRNNGLLTLPKTKSVTFGTNALLFRASLIWNKLPNEYKCASNLSIFKTKIKKWGCNTCSCQCCK